MIKIVSVPLLVGVTPSDSDLPAAGKIECVPSLVLPKEGGLVRIIFEELRSMEELTALLERVRWPAKS